VITVLDVSNMYLSAKALAKGQIQTLADKWTRPLEDAVIELLRAQIEADPRLAAEAQKNPEIMAILEGEQNAKPS
jgi:hypothetical protein